MGEFSAYGLVIGIVLFLFFTRKNNSNKERRKGGRRWRDEL